MTTPPLSCDEVVREIWDWLDHELDQMRWDELQVHLSTCTGCTEHMDFAREFLRKVREAPLPSGDLDALRDRVRSALRAS